MSLELETPMDYEMITGLEWGAKDTSATLSDKATLTRKMYLISHRRIPVLDIAISTPKRPMPLWLEPTTKKLEELSELPPNWDSYDAPSISEEKIYVTFNLLCDVMLSNTPIPSIVPTNTASVQFEWHMRNIDIEVEALSPEQFYLFFEDHETGEQWEEEPSSNLSKLKDFVNLLSSRTD